MTEMRSASASASSRYCVVSSSGRAVGDELADDVPHAQPAGRVEAGGRLVEEQHRRARHQAGGEVEAAAHAARVGLDHAVGGVGELEPLEQLGGPAPWRPAGTGSAERADQHEVLRAGEQLVEGGVLPGDADDAAHGRGVGDDVEAGDPGRAARRAGQRGEHADGGRLAGAVGAEHAEDAARPATARSTSAHGDLVAVALAEALGLDHRGRHGHRSCVLRRRSRSDLPYGK